MRAFFKADDFLGLMSNEAIAKEANEKLNKLIESWPVAYGCTFGANINKWIFAESGLDKTKTHKAYLAFIEEIEKEPCKHEPLEVVVETGQYTKSVTFDYSTDSKCKHCGVELQATWSEKK